MNNFIKIVIIAMVVFCFSLVGAKIAFSQADKGPGIYSTGEEYQYTGSNLKKKEIKALGEVYRYNKEKRDECVLKCDVNYTEQTRMEECQGRNERQGNELKGQCVKKHLNDMKLSCLTNCMSGSVERGIGVKKSNQKSGIYK